MGASLTAAPAAPSHGPEIRMSQRNAVPGCVTPERLMTFLRTRNGGLDSRFGDIARHYKTHGETWRVRWDYAFYQMLVETNFLTYRAPGGRMGDVHPRQNNFAGIGTTGGGVPGDSFPNVSTGVLAQIQHLVVYSGERLENPTAPRTQLKMDEILTKSKALERPVTFQDLSGRWAIDRAYGRSIEWAAQSFRSAHCKDQPMASSDGMPSRQRMSAAWPRSGRMAATRSEQSSDDDGRERGSRANLGRPYSGQDVSRDKDSDERGGTRSPVKSAKRPLHRPIVTGAVRRSDPDEAPRQANQAMASPPPIAAPSSSSGPSALGGQGVQRQLPHAPPPIIRPKPPGQTAAATPPPALPDPPADKSATGGSGLKPTTTANAPSALPKAPPPASSQAPAASAPSAPQAPTSGGTQAAQPPAVLPTAPPSGTLAAQPSAVPARPTNPCKIFRASYGGPKTVLIQSQKDTTTNYTVLEVTVGREQEQAKAFMDAHARGGKIIGEYPLEAEALKKSFELCPGG